MLTDVLKYGIQSTLTRCVSRGVGSTCVFVNSSVPPREEEDSIGCVLSYTVTRICHVPSEGLETPWTFHIVDRSRLNLRYTSQIRR